MDIDTIKKVWTTTDGRIGRHTFWVYGLLPLVVALLIVYAVYNPGGYRNTGNCWAGSSNLSECLHWN